ENNIHEFVTDNQSPSARQELVNCLSLPTSYTLEETNASVLLTNDLSTKDEEIEMQPMNNNPMKSSSPTWQIVHMPPDCCPKRISKSFSCCAKCIPKLIQEQWTYLRSLVHRFVELRFFKW
ncbi:unnamed protein product, partial [Rotaria sordida]